MNKESQKSFTLLELLVVIAIIAILAGVVIASVVDLRQRAKESKGMQFSQNIRTTLSNDLVGEWNFDEGIGVVAKDTSDEGNEGRLFNLSTQCTNPPTSPCPTWTDGKIKGALQFYGNNGYVDCGDSNELDLSKEITIEAWIYPTPPTLTYYRAIVAKYSQSDNKRAYQLIVDEGYSKYLGQGTIQFWISSNGSTLRDHVEAPGELNKWQHVVGVYNGSKMTIYVNGELKDEKNTTISSIFVTDRPLRIGSDQVLSRFFLGKIDEVRIYGSALTAKQIKNLYAESLPRHLTSKNETR
ncbi:MAG: prepilin-type N-terminal cleavage/methylation domain-containing protein [Candidatus Pacebacteria bacterium]|nr:prepilin-type N-terminal cleavage/methylation domain-containing protein [Candidatus Paceibacterota bacterium]